MLRTAAVPRAAWLHGSGADPGSRWHLLPRPGRHTGGCRARSRRHVRRARGVRGTRSGGFLRRHGPGPGIRPGRGGGEAVGRGRRRRASAAARGAGRARSGTGDRPLRLRLDGQRLRGVARGQRRRVVDARRPAAGRLDRPGRLRRRQGRLRGPGHGRVRTAAGHPGQARTHRGPGGRVRPQRLLALALRPPHGPARARAGRPRAAVSDPGRARPGGLAGRDLRASARRRVQRGRGADHGAEDARAEPARGGRRCRSPGCSTTG